MDRGVWSNWIRWILIYSVVCLGRVKLFAAAQDEPRYDNPNFTCPGYNGPDDDFGYEIDATNKQVENKISNMTFRWLAGCNEASLREKRKIDPARYRLLQHYYIHAINESLYKLDRENKEVTKRARRVPLCVRSTGLNGIYSAQMHQFYDIILELENKEKEYVDKPFFYGDPPIWFPRQNQDYVLSTDTNFGVEDIRLTRIFTGDPKMPRLRQWFHLGIYLGLDEHKQQITKEGIYIQAISAPMGLPFGEFRNDFDCDDPKSPLKTQSLPHVEITHDGYYKDSLVFPCSYRAAYHLRHPNVWTVGGKPLAGGSEHRYPEFHIHFNWIDSTCYEAIAMQFLIILVESFKYKKYDVFYTPALNHTYLDSNDGLPYPFYPGWKIEKSVSCNGQSASLYDELPQFFIETGDIPEPVLPSEQAADMIAEDEPQLEEMKESDEDEPPAHDDFFRNPVREYSPEEGDKAKDSPSDGDREKDYPWDGEKERDFPSGGDESDWPKDDQPQNDDSDYFQQLNRNNPENPDVKRNADDEQPADPELEAPESPDNVERKRRIDDEYPEVEAAAASSEVDSGDDSLANMDTIENSREVKSADKFYESITVAAQTDSSIVSTTQISVMKYDNPDQRLLSEYQKVLKKKNIKENDEGDLSAMSASGKKTNTNEPRMKKVSFSNNKTNAQSESTSFLKRRKRESSDDGPKPAVPEPKCRDRDDCISGQFQIVRRDISIIQYNKDYDDCVMSGRVITSHAPLECPPLPVTCEKYADALQDKPANRLKYRAYILDRRMCDICSFPDDNLIFRKKLPPEIPIVGPSRAVTTDRYGDLRRRPVVLDSLVSVGYKDEPVFAIYPDGTKINFTTPARPLFNDSERSTTQMTTTTTTTPVVDSSEDDPDGHIPTDRLKHFDRLIIYKNQASKLLHGWLLIFAWFFLAPAANFAARYFKETGGIKGGGVCGMPIWLVAHIGLYSFAFLCMGIGVISISFVIELNCDRLPLAADKKSCETYEGGLVSAHSVFGILALLCLLPQYILGWIRPLTLGIQFVIQIVHSCGGYLAFVFAILSVFLSQTCAEIPILVALMIIIHLIFWFVGCVFQSVQDRNMRVSRKVFPVLQVVELRENPPQGMAKKILQYAHDFSIAAISILLMVSYNRIAANDPLSNLDYNYTELTNASSAILEFDGGLFPVECTRSNFIYFFQQIGCDDSGSNATKVTFWCNSAKNETI